MRFSVPLRELVTVLQSVPNRSIAMDERRHDCRFDISKPAKIVAADDDAPIFCIVKDISVSGGCLELSTSVELPETFKLIPDDGNPLGYSCRVMWRQGGLIGIKFDE